MTPPMFVGADPVALVGLAGVADQYSIRLDLARRAVGDLLAQNNLHPTMQQALSRVSSELAHTSNNLRWRAEAIDEAQRISMPPAVGDVVSQTQLVEFANLGLFDLGRWEEAFAEWRSAPTASELLSMTPGQARQRLSALSPALAKTLVAQIPAEIGGLDGAPPELRYAANTILIEREIEALGRDLVALSGGNPDKAMTRLAIEAVQDRMAEYQRWLSEGRQILLFDPSGDGRIVEVFGDLTAASNVAVAVPGMANSLTNFSVGDGGFRRNAINLFEQAGAETVATIAWLGYDTPDGADATLRGAAEAGVTDLQAFLRGIDPVGEKHVTVIAHSYGSVLAGLAATEGLEVDDLVFVGSPGTTLDDAADARLRTEGRVWSALAEGDPIAVGVSPEDLLFTWPIFLNPVGFARKAAGLLRGPEEIWHGANPADEAFGALRITTEGCSGHSSYFERGGLENLALIVTGRDGEVGLVD